MIYFYKITFSISSLLLILKNFQKFFYFAIDPIKITPAIESRSNTTDNMYNIYEAAPFVSGKKKFYQRNEKII